jgi:hypothetical protein
MPGELDNAEESVPNRTDGTGPLFSSGLTDETLSPGRVRRPAGPHQDPTFRSIPIGDEFTEEDVTPDVVEAACVLLARNVFSLVPIENIEVSSRRISESPEDGDAANMGMLEQLEQAGRIAVREVATDFVKYHVRRLTKDVALRRPHDKFKIGTVLISMGNVPNSRTRHAKFQWAITGGRVFQLRHARIPASHVGPYVRASNLELSSRVTGDEVACFLAYVLDLLDVTPLEPIAATGDISTNTNELLFAQNLDELLEAAHLGGMHDVVLPRKNQKMNDEHAGVDYWPSKDTNDAIFSVLHSLSGEEIDPNLRRRALTKQAYSWVSLICTLLAVGGYQLAVALGSNPPVTFIKYLLAFVAFFFVGSFFFTDRYWKMDR